MDPHDEAAIRRVLAEGVDATLATLLPDGAPHATTVSYASDGLKLYFGCSARAQKALNLARDDRIAGTVTLPYKDWSQIRGVSFCGRARRLAGEELEKAALLFVSKFDEIAQYVSADAEDLALFEVRPETISLLDYTKGFGHVVHVNAA